MIEAWTGLFGQSRRRNLGKSFNKGRDKGLGTRRKSDVQRATSAIVAAAVLVKRCGCAGRVVIVLGHAHGHLSADGHEHDERQTAN